MNMVSMKKVSINMVRIVKRVSMKMVSMNMVTGQHSEDGQHEDEDGGGGRIESKRWARK